MRKNCVICASAMRLPVLQPRMPRAMPSVSSMASLRASARRWSSAALGDANPKAWQISARVCGSWSGSTSAAEKLPDCLVTGKAPAVLMAADSGEAVPQEVVDRFVKALPAAKPADQDRKSS